MNAAAHLLILAITVGAPTAKADTSSSNVFKCDFEAASDVNFDGWPDDWTRRRGKQFPQYLNIEIGKPSIPSPSGGNALTMELDGGEAVIYAPRVPVSPLLGYHVQASLLTTQLKHHRAYIEVIFFNKDGKPVENFYSQKRISNDKWSNLDVGPITPSHPSICEAGVVLHLRAGAKSDLFGTATFDGIQLARVPRINTTTNSPFNIYKLNDPIEITCRVSGIQQNDAELLFELLDYEGEVLQSNPVNLITTKLGSTVAIARSVAQKVSIPNADMDDGYAGNASWQPDILQPGFYRVRLTVANQAGVSLQRVINLAVIASSRIPIEGEFGWSLPQGNAPLDFKDLSDLVANAGVNWIKFPIWYDHEHEKARSNQMSWFFERLANVSIRTIGMVTTPPDSQRDTFAKRGELVVADVFSDPSEWGELIEPVVNRFSLKVRWWQLGADRDTSFIGYPQLVEKIASIKKLLEKSGQDIHVGLSWDWVFETPQQQYSPWKFLSYTELPAMTHAELDSYLDYEKKQTFQRWVSLEPLDRERYEMSPRVRDLVKRMVAAKRTGASGIFCPRPFHPQHGMMTANGEPNDLFIPWRTTALTITGTTFLGSLQLPGGSENYVFASGSEAVMVIWNDFSTNEIMNLGENVAMLDVWGREHQVGTTDVRGIERQVISVGPTPKFVTGLDLALAKWRIGFEFGVERIDSYFGRDQLLPTKFNNTFPQGVGGNYYVNAPSTWQLNGNRQVFQLGHEETYGQNLELMLRAGADSGQQLVRVDFEVAADKLYRFSLYRSVEVGLNNVSLDVQARISDQGDLVIEQTITNRGNKQVNFNCLLFAPDRQRERRQVLKLGQGRNITTFVLPKGEDLKNQTIWIRAEEIGGDRVLNHRLIVPE